MEGADERGEGTRSIQAEDMKTGETQRDAATGWTGSFEIIKGHREASNTTTRL